MKRLIFVLSLLTSFVLLDAQSTVTGRVVEGSGYALVGASAVLLQASDSILSKFDLSDPDGRFAIRDAPAGGYFLKITHIGYEDYFQTIQLDGQASISLGTITMVKQAATLEEVRVEAERIPIVIKGDTIQYNADAFQTRPNAPVEELLRKLPGLEVDRNGNIRAQGKEVDRVLVDGKEFFGDDPQIATQNLPAEIVDNVQVYDRKSDAAEFTGVDDGERNTTINLSLKEDKKQGYFGTLEAGYGTNNRFASKGSINRFSKDYQLSALGRLNNINEQGFTLQDYFNLMGGMQNVISNDNAINPRDLGINLDGDARSNGLATTSAGGLNLNYDLSRQADLSLNYFYNGMDRRLDRELERQYFQGENATFSTLEDEKRQAANTNHRLNSLLKFTIDSAQDLQVRVNFGWNDTQLQSNSLREAFSAQGNTESTLDRAYLFDNEQFNLDTRLAYRRKLQKPGRSIVAEVDYNTRAGRGESELQAASFFPLQPATDSLQQDQLTEEGQHNYATRLGYTEPLGKGYFLEFGYRRQDYQERFDREFYDFVNRQRIKNELLSNQFTSNYTFDRIGLALQRNRAKSNLTLRLEAQESRLEGSLQSDQNPLQRSFSFLLPSASWRYEFTSTKSLSMRYRTAVQEPSVTQLQPIIDNSDPLNIYIGNPELKPEYQHQLRTQLMWYDAFSFTSFFTLLDVRYTKNRITNAITIDEQLRQTATPANVGEDLFLFANSSFGTPLRFIKSRINLGAELAYNRGFLLLNEARNQVNQLNTSFNISLENRKKEIVDIRVGGEWGHQRTTYTLRDELGQSFSEQSYFVDGALRIGEQWQIHTLFDYRIFPQGPFASRQSFPLWEASISRYFGEKQQLQIRLSAFDLLNQNTGINRNATFNFIENENMVALGRYLMLSAVYNLKGFGS
jgi:hypothetical protein